MQKSKTKYVITNSKARSNINLEIENENIKNAVEEFNKHKRKNISINVFKDHYELIGKLTNGELRILGRIIAHHCQNLWNIIKKYIYNNGSSQSNQLFKRA